MVRPVPGRGDGTASCTHRRRRRRGRRFAPDLQLLRRQADDDSLQHAGHDADRLGNHNFDRGSATCARTLIPLANFPFLCANCLRRRPASTRRSGSPRRSSTSTASSWARRFTLPELTDLIFPGYLDPFHVTVPTAAIKAEAASCARKGKRERRHGRRPRGRRRHRSTNPTGALIDARRQPDGRRRRDRRPHRYPGHHPRPNGMLVTENLEAGIRFTRIRLVVDTVDQEGRLQDRRLPQAVGHRRHARPRHPGEDRRPQRPAGTDPQHRHRHLDEVHPAGGPVRSTRMAAPASRSSATSTTDALAQDLQRPTSRSPTPAACAPT